MGSRDEGEVHRHPHLRRLWRRRGTTVRVPAVEADARFTLSGALDDAAGRVIGQTAPAKDAVTFVAFLDHVAATWPTGQVRVVRDNVGDHQRRTARRWWVAHQERIRPRWLPVSSPERTRMERVWRHLKDNLANHRWWANLPALERATAEFLNRPAGIRLRLVQDSYYVA